MKAKNSVATKVKSASALKFEALAESIEALFSTGKFTMPWGAANPHCNAVSKNRYSGINAVFLAYTAIEAGYTSNQWATFKQLQGLGYMVKKGESGTPIAFYSRVTAKKDKDSHSDEEKNYALLKYFTVFNFNQCTDTDGNEIPSQPVEQEWMNAPTVAEQINFVHTLAERMEVELVYQAGNRAYYRSDLHKIVLPMVEQFVSEKDYVLTALHELGHASKKTLRSDWVSGGKQSVEYAKEEVVAELTAVFTASMFGIEKFPLDSHASYLNGWLNLAKQDDPKFFTKAIREASKAAYLMYDLMHPAEEESADSEEEAA